MANHSPKFLLTPGDPVVKDPVPAEFLKSRKGGQLLLDPHNHIYMLEKTKEAKPHWICQNNRIKASSKCKARATTQTFEGVEVETGTFCIEFYVI